MTSDPKIAHHPEQPYVAIRKRVKMAEIPVILPPLVPQIVQWMEEHNIAQAGPVFFRYLQFDHEDQLLVDVGVPTQAPVEVNGDVVAGSFPDADYVTVTYMGDYSNLKGVHMGLEAWMKENGLKEGAQKINGTEYAARTEFYLTDPDEVEDPKDWRTDVVILLAGR